MNKPIIVIVSCFLALAVFAQNNDENKDKNKNAKNKVQQKVNAAPKRNFQANPQHLRTTQGQFGPKLQGQGTQNKFKTTTTNPNLNKAKVFNKNVTKNQIQNNQIQKGPLNKTVTTYKPQHVGFHAQKNPNIAAVQFNKNYRIQGSQNWQGKNYIVFRNYRPIYRPRSYWRSHYNNVILIGGGWYYWNAGYWYPAWGYDPAYSYYPYDGPIYVGQRVVPPDQVIADVQTALQQQGYYQGEVDGLLGPLTREALANYQRDQGLYETETIDQPTLSSLGLS